jgi:hypothetical protein
MKIEKLSLAMLGSAFIAFASGNAAFAQPPGGYPVEPGQPVYGQPVYGQPAMQTAAPNTSERSARGPSKPFADCGWNRGYHNAQRRWLSYSRVQGDRAWCDGA